MARTPSNVPPPYPKKAHNGQARITVRITGGWRKDLVLGPHGSPESLAEYRRVLAELEAHGGFYSVQATTPAAADLTVNELLLQYWRWAEDHYRDPGGNPTRELDNLKDALRPLRRLYGHTLAKEFGPSALRSVQQEMARAGLCRSVVNFRTNRVRRVFKWAASYELLPVAVHQALQTVQGLRRGHGKVREADPVKPAPDDHVNATLPFLPVPVRAMVELQRLTGCRPGEVMILRAIDLNMTGPVWTYRPASHKNRHRGLDRVVFLGPQAQVVVKPFLTTDLQAYLFSPLAYVEALRRRRSAQRKTKRTPSELKRKRKAKPQRVPAERYNRRSYRLAIVRACRKAGVPEWSPLQLRHTAATAIRARYGVEAAKVILGHTKVETTQIYAERDLGKAQEIMAEIG
jgi:integrase